VRLVLAVTGDHAPTNEAVRMVAEGIGGNGTATRGTPARVTVVPQQRIGMLRAGKGDAINTGFKLFLEDPGLERIHFYDADIKTFDGDWISKAEAALDDGFDAVRHFYPRAATDAMITWMVTRLGFAKLWPQSPLPTIEQPLSGELAFSRAGAAIIFGDARVRLQSDWGVDTAITFATIAHRLSLYESYIPRGKDHALYSSLSDIKVMMVECLAALQRLRDSGSPTSEGQPRRVSEPADSVSQQITQQIGFDVEATQRLLASEWTDGQESLLASHFPTEIANSTRSWRHWPDTTWMDEKTWFQVLTILLDRFTLDDDDWCQVAFRLWVGRVLNYTLRTAVRGHAFANSYLHVMVERAVAQSRND